MATARPIRSCRACSDRKARAGHRCGGTAPVPTGFPWAQPAGTTDATAHSLVSPDTDPVMVGRAVDPSIVAWSPQGQDDPALLLLRFDPSSPEPWLNGPSLVAGLKMLPRTDPKRDYQDHVTKGRLS